MKAFLHRFDLFLNRQFFIVLFILIIIFSSAYAFPFLLFPAKILLMVVLCLQAIDLLALIIVSQPVLAIRETTAKWSLGDINIVYLEIANKLPINIQIKLEDELPNGIEMLEEKLNSTLKPFEKVKLNYHVKPCKRGLYNYGKMRLFVRTYLGFFSRRVSINSSLQVAVYPSFIQLNKYQFFGIKNINKWQGSKRMNRLGQSYEFEQIKEYILGDDMRHINWKVTGKTGSIKTNHFVEEKSQSIYAVIDKSRTMNFGFDGLSLVDYAINSSLILLSNALQKGDNAGLITFSDKTGCALRADNHPNQMRRITDALYNEQYRTTEADYELLYLAVNKLVSTRSLFVLYTNYESNYAMQRALNVLRKLAKKHLLLVVLFENTELTEFSYSNATDIQSVYNRMIARQWLLEKRSMVNELNSHGIQAMLVQPQNATVAILNRYNELKSHNMI